MADTIMRNRNRNRRFGIQRLEDRRLLAADVAMELTFVETAEPEICEVQSIDSQAESETTAESSGEVLDLESTEISLDNLDSPAVTDNEVATQEVDSNVHDLGDPVDGTDGFFGSLDAENSSQQFNISPSEDGLVDIAIASSFGESETRLNVTDSNGDLVISGSVEGLDGFKQVSFEGDAGENYLLTISSEEGTEGLFQLTVGHSETPEPVDQHADTIGETSTELTFNEGVSTLDGDIESAGDIDTFRFTADADGRASLGLGELNADNATELSVQVFESEGEQISRGITNESVGISFDVEAGAEYFLSVNAAEGETGSYRIDLSVEPTIIAPTDAEAEATDTEPTDTEPSSEDTSSASDTTVDENTADKPIEEPTVVEESDEEPAGDTEPEIVDDLTDETTLIENSEDETTGEVDTELVADTETQSSDGNTELVADPTEESDIAPVDESDIDPVVETEVEAGGDVELVDSTDELTADADLTDEVVAETADGDQSVEVEIVDNLDTSDGEATETVDGELPTSDDPTSVSDAEIEAEIAPVAADPIDQGNANDALVGCDPIPVDVIDSESTETVTATDESSSEPEVEVTEVVNSVPENTTTDLAESFEPSETETDETETTAEIDAAGTVENLIDTVLDAAGHVESFDDLIDGGFDGLFGDADVAVAEQAVDSFFSDANLVDDLIRL